MRVLKIVEVRNYHLRTTQKSPKSRRHKLVVQKKPGELAERACSQVLPPPLPMPESYKNSTKQYTVNNNTGTPAEAPGGHLPALPAPPTTTVPPLISAQRLRTLSCLMSFRLMETTYIGYWNAHWPSFRLYPKECVLIRTNSTALRLLTTTSYCSI